MNLRDHPTVKRYYEKKAAPKAIESAARFDSARVRQVVPDAGADDVGLASIDSPALAEYRSKPLTVFPGARTCISVVCRMNPENVRSSFRPSSTRTNRFAAAE